MRAGWWTRLEAAHAGFDQQLKLNVTGCPNSCGQHWIADIGIEGKKIKQDGKLVDAYYFCVGGAVGLHQNTRASGRLSLPGHRGSRRDGAIAAPYLADPGGGKSAGILCSTHEAEIRDQLAGTVVAPVERDVSPGPVPPMAG